LRPVVVTVGPLAAASANAIALSQTPVAGALTLNGALVVGGVAIMDTPRQVLITTTANETAHTFTIKGTDWANSPISEIVTGVNNATVASVLSYKTVTSLTISANATGALTIGTNGVAASPWVRLDEWATPSVQVQCVTSGTVNYTVQQTQDDPNSATNPVAPQSVTWAQCPDLNLVAQAATAQAQYTYVPTFIRVLLNSGSGSVMSPTENENEQGHPSHRNCHTLRRRCVGGATSHHLQSSEHTGGDCRFVWAARCL
jgi:hypothetical protein